MNNKNLENFDSDSGKHKLFVFGFIQDTSVPYYDFAESLSKPAAYFRNDELYEKFKRLNALGNYWQIVSSVLEERLGQRDIFIANVPFNVIEGKQHSHKLTLAESRLVMLPVFKYVHFTRGSSEIFVPRELEFSYQELLPKEII
ncbi:MAG: hypothetical protein ABI621_20335 [Chloroflexota bacterium]